MGKADDILSKAKKAPDLSERAEVAGGVRVSANPTRYSRLQSDLKMDQPEWLRWIGVLDTGEIFFFKANDSYHIEMARRLGVGGAGMKQDPALIPGHAIPRQSGETTWWEIACSWQVETGSWNYELYKPIKSHPNFNRMMEQVRSLFSDGNNKVAG